MREFLKLELYPNPANKISYPGHIQEVREKSFLIAGPFDRGTLLFLYPGQEVLVEYIDEGCRYQFSTRVQHRLQRPFYGYELFLPEPETVKRIQLRRFVRYKKVLDVCYALPQDDRELNWKKAKSVDISCGGIRLALKEEVAIGSLFKIKFNLEIKGKDYEFIFDGEVKRVEKTQVGVYHCGIEFKNVSQKEQDLLFSYLFQEMQKSKRMLVDGKW